MGEEISSRAVASRGTGYPDYEINIRELSDIDVPQMPLPYDANVVLTCLNTTVPAGSYGQASWVQSDWGSGKAFYPYFYTIEITHDDGELLNTSEKSFWLYVRADDIEETRNFLRETWDYRNFKMIRTKVAAVYKWKWMKTIDLRGMKVPYNWTMRIYLQNNTGVLIEGFPDDYAYRHIVIGVAL